MKAFIAHLMTLGTFATSLIAISTTPGFSFDRQTTQALQACHDYLWNEVPEFESLPNAAISVYPGTVDGNIIVVNWVVNWEELRKAGTCTVIDGNLEGYDEF